MIIKTFKAIVREFLDWIEFFLRNIPGRAGKILRRIYYGIMLCECSSLSLSEGCIITAPENIRVGSKVSIMRNSSLYANNNGLLEIGSRVSINSNVILDAADNGKIIIGNDVLIGPNVVIRSSNHQYKDKSMPINKQGHRSGNILIEDDVWIAANVVILPDVKIGKGAVIGAGAVVNRDIPPYALAGGVPARVIKENIRVENNIQ